MRIVGMDDRRLPLSDDSRQLPRRRQVNLVDRREWNQIRTLGGAAKQLALAMRDQHGAMAASAKTQNGQEGLLLSPAPGARGVDVEGEHSSHSFANFNP